MLINNISKSIIILTAVAIFSGCSGVGVGTPSSNTNKALTDQKTLAISSLQRRNYKQALEEIGVAEQMSAKDPEVHLIRGIILFAIQDIPGAENSYKKAIEIDKNYSEAHFNLCGLYLQQQKYEPAIEHCKKASEDRLYKSRDRALTTIGVAYFNLGDLDRAKDYFEQSLNVNPALVYTHNELGKLYVAQGRLDSAISEFQSAVDGYPMYDEAHYNLGITYIKINEIYKACASFNKVIEISPNSAIGRKAKEYINFTCSGIY